MPSTSKKQHNFMAAVAKNPAFAKKAGVPRSVGQEFLNADKGRKFDGESSMKEVKKMAFGGGTAPKVGQMAAAHQLAAAQRAGAEGLGTGLRKMGANPMNPALKNKAGGAGMKMSPADLAKTKSLSDVMRGNSVATPSRSAGLGAAAKTGLGSLASAKQRAIGGMAAMKKLTGAKKGGLLAGKKSADGIATKGKSKGTMVKMAYGGKACK